MRRSAADVHLTTPSNVSGVRMNPARFHGHTRSHALPTTAFSETNGPPGLLMCCGEANESPRLSPMTQSFPRGTVTLNGVSCVDVWSKRYGSSRTLPLTVSLPFSVQQTTLSPPTPM